MRVELTLAKVVRTYVSVGVVASRLIIIVAVPETGRARGRRSTRPAVNARGCSAPRRGQAFRPDRRFARGTKLLLRTTPPFLLPRRAPVSRRRVLERDKLHPREIERAKTARVNTDVRQRAACGTTNNTNTVGRVRAVEKTTAAISAAAADVGKPH